MSHRHLPSEKRHTKRFPMIAPVTWHGGKGITEDMSTRGLYLVTGRPLQPGQRVSLTVVLHGQAIRIAGVGKVVRVDPQGTGYGVGLEFEHARVLPVVPSEALGQQN